MATIIDLGDPNAPLPDYLLLDASVLLRLLFGDAKIVQFVDRVAQAYRDGDTIALVCILTLEECYHKIIQREYERDLDPSLQRFRQTTANKRGIPLGHVRWHDLYKERPRFIGHYLTDIDAFFQMVARIPVHVLEPEDLADSTLSSPPIEPRMRDIMRSYYLLGKDAYMVAIAERLKVQHIATLDPDFQRLGPNFTLHTIV